MRSPIVPVLLVATMVAIAACGSGGDTSEVAAVATTTSPSTGSTTAPETTEPGMTEPETTEPETTEPEATEPTATSEPTSTATSEPVVVGAWQSILAEGCVCSDGSSFELWERPADPTKVVLYLEGGGACFSEETCGSGGSLYTQNLDLGVEPDTAGIFDADNPENPFSGYSVVYVPYCTGDVHLGGRVNQYSESLTISHTGFDNASRGLDTVLTGYPDVEQLVVAGSSAGSIPVPAFAGLAADALPDTEIIAIGDASGAYPDIPELNAQVGGEWGALNNVPDWPVNDGLTAEEWSFPGLYVQAGTQHPDITFARFDNAFDAVQIFFSGLLDVPASDLLSMIEATEAQIEAGGVPIASYIAPGGDHTILGLDALYGMEVEGVRFVDFLAALVDGDVPDDVSCTVCS
jgi:hypothetical protein